LHHVPRRRRSETINATNSKLLGSVATCRTKYTLMSSDVLPGSGYRRFTIENGADKSSHRCDSTPHRSKAIPSLAVLCRRDRGPADSLGGSGEKIVGYSETPSASHSRRTSLEAARSSRQWDDQFRRRVFERAVPVNCRNIQCVHTRHIGEGEATSHQLPDTLRNPSQSASTLN
jgi:hypothetical protein